jgi:HK97 family phage portal protein
MGLFGQIAASLPTVLKAGEEGQYREGPYYLPYSGGWLSADAGRHWNWWQMGHDVSSGGGINHMVESCVSAYSQTIAMCPGNHWQWEEKAGRKRITTSALTRILRAPNDYQTISDLLLNAVRGLLLEGNAYLLAIRNERQEIQQLHLMGPKESGAHVAEDGSVFYNLAGNPIVEQLARGAKIVVPSRDVLHLRLHTPRHPLLGETPLAAAALQLSAGNAAMHSQVIFYLNQARPSFALGTDAKLNREQARELRDLWNEQAAGMAKGGTPVLTAGLKPLPLGVSQVDQQLADLLKLSDQAIANVYRVPLQLLGLNTGTFSSTEALMQHWLASGLGFLLNHIEEAFGLQFKLKGQPDEYLEFDTAALQRSSFKERVIAWANGTKGGLFSRNEGRREFELPSIGPPGDEPWVQQQDIPASVAYENAKNPPEPVAPVATPPKPAESDEEAAAQAERDFAAVYRAHLVEKLDAA